jgi:hypothetical protein
MASTFSTDLKIELMATGENSGTWGTKTNTNLDLVQQAIVGFENIAITSTNTTLLMTDAQVSTARNAILRFTGTITANCTVFVASGIEKPYTLENATSGAFTLALNQVGGASVIFGAADKTTKLVYLNGTDAVDLGIVNLTAPQTLTNKTLTTPTLTSPIINEIDDSNGNEQIIFTATASAVNEVTVANAATGNDPTFTASGSDTNIGLDFIPKGTGAVTFLGTGKIQAVKEKVTVTAVASTGTINYDFLTQAVLYHTTVATGQFTINLRGSSSTSLTNMLSVGESVTGAFLNTNTTFYVSTITIDGSSTNVTLEYQGGAAPTAGNAGIDVYSFTAIKTATTPAYTILASQTQFN